MNFSRFRRVFLLVFNFLFSVFLIYFSTNTLLKIKNKIERSSILTNNFRQLFSISTFPVYAFAKHFSSFDFRQLLFYFQLFQFLHSSNTFQDSFFRQLLFYFQLFQFRFSICCFSANTFFGNVLRNYFSKFYLVFNFYFSKSWLIFVRLKTKNQKKTEPKIQKKTPEK